MLKLRLVFLLFFGFISVIDAKGDLTSQQPVTKTITLGNSNNKLRFYPDTLSFETGKLYKLIIKNPSPQKHFFTNVGFSDAVFTRKVQIKTNDNISVAEVKGVVNEIEVYPGGIAEWWFVPVKTLNASRLHCSIKGHSEAGMNGTISIK